MNRPKLYVYHIEIDDLADDRLTYAVVAGDATSALLVANDLHNEREGDYFDHAQIISVARGMPIDGVEAR